MTRNEFLSKLSSLCKLKQPLLYKYARSLVCGGRNGEALELLVRGDEDSPLLRPCYKVRIQALCREVLADKQLMVTIQSVS